MNATAAVGCFLKTSSNCLHTIEQRRSLGVILRRRSFQSCKPLSVSGRNGHFRKLHTRDVCETLPNDHIPKAMSQELLKDDLPKVLSVAFEAGVLKPLQMPVPLDERGAVINTANHSKVRNFYRPRSLPFYP